MRTYFFIFGTHPNLSLAELEGYFASNGIPYKIELAQDDFAVIAIGEIDPNSFFHALGGVIKYGLIIHHGNGFHDVIQKVHAGLAEFALAHKKIFFGLSAYGNSAHSGIRKNKIHALGMEIKKELAARGIRSRLVTGKNISLSSVHVSTNKLLDPCGREWVLLFGNQGEVYCGYTRMVQDYKAFSVLDYGRPKRDSRSGMLPVKIARVMVNLAQLPKNSWVLDPFCGSGTIIQEALLQGYSCVGTDQSGRAVRDSSENIKWLKAKTRLRFITQKQSMKRQRFQITDTPECMIMACDARFLDRYFSPRSFEAIVTEPYLGEYNIRQKNLSSVQKTIHELSALYQESFHSFRNILKPSGRVVMVWPVYRIGRNHHYLPIVDDIKKIGFSPKRYSSPIQTNSRGALEYFRPQQVVGREIWIWKMQEAT